MKKSTHSFSKVVGSRGDGYRPHGNRIAKHNSKMSRPDIHASSSKGSNSVDNTTYKNHA